MISLVSPTYMVILDNLCRNYVLPERVVDMRRRGEIIKHLRTRTTALYYNDKSRPKLEITTRATTKVRDAHMDLMAGLLTRPPFI